MMAENNLKELVEELQSRVEHCEKKLIERDQKWNWLCLHNSELKKNQKRNTELESKVMNLEKKYEDLRKLLVDPQSEFHVSPKRQKLDQSKRVCDSKGITNRKINNMEKYVVNPDDSLQRIDDTAVQPYVLSPKFSLLPIGDNSDEGNNINLAVRWVDLEVHVVLQRTTKLFNVKEVFSKKVQIKLSVLRFIYDGCRVSDEATPDQLGMNNNDVIEVIY